MIVQQTAQKKELYKHLYQYGFTLIELLIVVVILSTLAAMVVPSFSNSVSDSRSGVIGQNVRIVQLALDGYHATLGFYPTPSTWGQVCTGFGTSLIASSGGEHLRNQLTMFTDADGVVCDSRTDSSGKKYPQGPYLNQKLPYNAVYKSNSVQIIAGESTTPDPSHGWRFDYNSGLFSAMTE